MLPEPAAGIEPGRYQALLEVSSSILAHQQPEPLIHDLGGLLGRLLKFDFLSLVLYDPVQRVMKLRILTSVSPPETQPSYAPTPIEDSPAGWVWQRQTPLIINDLEIEQRWPRVLEIARRNHIGSAIFLPLTSAQRRLGALGFGFSGKREFPAQEVEFLASVCAQVAVAVDNALSHQQVQQQRDQLEVLLEINNALAFHRDERDLFRAVSACLARVTPHDYASLSLYDPEHHNFTLKALEFPESSGLIQPDLVAPVDGSPAALALERRAPAVVDGEWLLASPSRVAQALYKEGIRSLVCLPLTTPNRTLGTLNIGSFSNRAFTDKDVAFFSRVSAQVAIAVENSQAFREITSLKDRLAEEKLYLEDEIRSERNFSEIIGQSPRFQRILKQVETVAPTPATVLILGETGTGKELIARAIHSRSDRGNRTFVKINCAAIPTGLLESELFGHERGAFTGAVNQKIGRLELANGGTLFLDEVGDIPLELQPKLLRALQEHEFERLGGTRTMRVDIRLVAATNRDLTQMVADGRFRADLYYRLNVFPIQLPPLRSRMDDIPLLVRHFTRKLASRMGRQFDTITSESLERMRRYDWPGNVRELENLIERAVILSPGPVLQIPELGSISTQPANTTTLVAAERSHILRVLKESGWKIAGPDGAAARLGMKRTTLQSRMKKLQIARPS